MILELFYINIPSFSHQFLGHNFEKYRLSKIFLGFVPEIEVTKSVGEAYKISTNILECILYSSL